MENKNLIEPIYRVEYKNKKGRIIAASCFFESITDAIEYIKYNEQEECELYIHKYDLKK